MKKSGIMTNTQPTPAWTLGDILLATGGLLVSNAGSAGQDQAAAPSFRGIATDSRALTPGDIFLALRGENFDGQAFTAQALQMGASGLIIERPLEPMPSVPVVLVPNSLQALGDLAAFRRRQLKWLKVVAITGSSGKTTVKEMTASILEGCGPTIKTQGNFNNLIGLPLSLLPAHDRHHFAVMEMGMNAPGEIARLTIIADPDVACITNVHPAHLAGLGTIEGVARAKNELFAGCRDTAILVVNLDDPLIRKLGRVLKQQQITFGCHRGATVRATHLKACGQEGISFTLHLAAQTAQVKLRALGRHNVVNALAAAATALAAGAGLEQIVAGLEAFAPGGNRLGLCQLPCGLQVINDSYNANPASMQAALATVAMIRGEARTVAVLGDMLELGGFSTEAHGTIGTMVAQQGFDYLCAVGDQASILVAAAQQAGMAPAAARICKDKDEAAAFLLGLLAAGHLQQNDLILVKGSRGMRMEQVIAALNH
jgi:UDP-N-acetylmuramoyl-tripeptide--D-alanyl-D-alanine ligase